MKALFQSSIVAICCGFALSIVLTADTATYPSFNPDIWFNPKNPNPAFIYSECLRNGILAMSNRNDLFLRERQIDKLTMMRADLQEISDNAWIELVFGTYEGTTYLFRLSTVALQPSGFMVRHGYSCNAHTIAKIPAIKQRPVSVSLKIGDGNVSACVNGKEVDTFKTDRRIPPENIGFRFSWRPVLVKSLCINGFSSGAPVRIDQKFEKGSGIGTVIA